MDLFDEIIETLKNKQEISSGTCITPETLKTFYSTEKKEQTCAGSSCCQKSHGSSEKCRSNTANSGTTPEYSNLNMDQLHNLVSSCTKCDLCHDRTNTVFGEGSYSADLMLIGEGPGRDEDEQGRPFVGRSGQLLTKMLKAMGFAREEVFIANIVKCRPPGNRNPNPDEAGLCMPYLLRQIELIQPQVILLLGAVPTKIVLDKTGITRIHGQWFEFKGIKTLPTFHPAFLLRDPRQKKHAWEDLQKVMKVLGKL